MMLCFWASYAAKAQTAGKHAFTLRGTVDTHSRDTIDIRYTNEAGQIVKDSVISNNPNFIIKGYLAEPSTMWLNLRGKDRSYKKSGTFFIEPGEMTIAVNKNDVNLSVMTGSATQHEFDRLNKAENIITQEIASPTGQYAKETDGARRSIRKDRIRALEFTFIAMHPNSYLSPFLMKKYAGYQYRDSLAAQYQKLTEGVKNSVAGKQIYAYLQLPAFKPQTPKVGGTAPDFTETGINNEQVSLSAYRGKHYILLDFWASWCGPCLAMLPKVKELYTKYHHKGLEVIGINMDYTPEKWRKAVAHEQMTQWKNIYPAKIELSNEYPLLSSYGITTIPALFLIDKNGMLVDMVKDEQGGITALEKHLAKIFE